MIVIGARSRIFQSLSGGPVLAAERPAWVDAVMMELEAPPTAGTGA